MSNLVTHWSGYGYASWARSSHPYIIFSSLDLRTGHRCPHGPDRTAEQECLLSLQSSHPISFHCDFCQSRSLYLIKSLRYWFSAKKQILTFTTCGWGIWHFTAGQISRTWKHCEQLHTCMWTFYYSVRQVCLLLEVHKTLFSFLMNIWRVTCLKCKLSYVNDVDSGEIFLLVMSENMQFILMTQDGRFSRSAIAAK